MSIIKKLAEDFKQNSKSTNCIRTLIDVNFYIILNYRFGNFFYRIKLYPISKLFWFMNRVIFSVDINMKSDLAGGLRFIHGIGIVIGNKVRTEGAVKIYQGVTLGGNHGKSKSYNGKKISMPVIKQNVSIYSGAKILGPVVIGENSSVGVNAVITRDIPENTIAYGVNQIKAKEDD